MAASATPATGTLQALEAFTTELDRIAPRFEIHGSQVRILREPAEFYETLKVGDIVLV
jgi:CDP-diacylglycerol--glycerol-3-phosphate 3-phosphatidyltransferase